MAKISVSILIKSDDETIIKLNNTTADYLHIDVMDGIFVSNSSFPMERIKEISNISTKPLDIHLMVEDPSLYIDELSRLNVAYITVHFESLNGNYEVLDIIKENHIKCGLSIKPQTKVESIFPILNKIDLVLIMSVEPGLGGQEFILDSLDKVKLLKNEIVRVSSDAIISIDGGINDSNSKLCLDAGCGMLVSGSYITSFEHLQDGLDMLSVN